MAGAASGGISQRGFAASVVAIALLVVAQSVAHLVVVLGRDDLHSSFDLDRSNGLPDLVSTALLAGATVAAVVLAWHEKGARRAAPAVAAGVLAALMLADLLHDGAHPSRPSGVLVVGLVVGTVAALAVISLTASRRDRLALIAAACTLGGSFVVSGLDWFDQWFERNRGDPVAEYEIVAKEGLELAGWALVALALTDAAVRRRRLNRARLPADVT